MKQAYTPAELMVVVAAREIKDREVVFVGMRLPLIAFAVAKRLHAPNAIGFFENGVVRDTPSASLLYTMGDPPNIEDALQCCRMTTVMGLMQKGEVDLGFLGGAEVDRNGNINTSYVGDPSAPRVKLPGSGGAADIASLARRFVVIIEHNDRRLVERVGYLTSPGNGDGAHWRANEGLPRGGPAAIITTMGVLRFGFESGEAYLDTIHPGVKLEDVKAKTGWPLMVTPVLKPTPEPTDEELRIIREVDPKRFWTS
ncbi:MAG: CoA-transferase [Candidatus Eremiobacteraeota bacterium]|nr:CoA-transferase [Candidatus Eremiobacteraeota bacterium]MBV8365954.1 CoA-transferase [Candidatus Eremiobacteraeota bacterium]